MVVEDVTGGPGAKMVKVGFKDVPVREESLTPVQLLERAGLDPLEFELCFPGTREPISPYTTLKIENGMKLDAVVKPR
jgi:hypothetical protein